MGAFHRRILGGMSGHQKRRARRLLVQRDGQMCWYCKAPGTMKSLTLDHVIPRVHGGGNGLTNLRLACFPCNIKKGATMPTECNPPSCGDC